MCGGVKRVECFYKLEFTAMISGYAILREVEVVCSVTVAVSATTGTIANMVPSTPSWAYAGKKLFLYNVKCM